MMFLALKTALIAAGLSIPLLLLLYFLKLRRLERKIPSTLLWKKAVQDLQVNAPFQKLRRNLLLLLQMLVLLAILFAISNPIINSLCRPEHDIVIIIDRSGSMKTVEEDGRTRLEHAKAAATEFVDSMQSDSRAMVIGFADRANVICSFSSDKRRLKQMIDRIEATDAPSHLSEALQLAEAYSTKLVSDTGEGWLPDSAEMADVELFSDGRIRDAKESFLSRGTARYHRVGEAKDNAGIVSFDVRRNLENPGVVQVFAQVENFGPTEIKSDVSLNLNGALLAVEEVSLGPVSAATTQPSATALPDSGDGLAAARNVIFEIENEAGGHIEIKLHREDALALDNLVIAPIDPPRSVRVLVVSSRREVRYLMQRAFVKALEIDDLTLMTATEYEEAPAEQLAIEGRSAFDLVVLDKHDTDRLWPGNYVFFGGVPLTEGVGMGDVIENEIFVHWQEGHPLLRYVSDSVIALKWKKLQLPLHATSLIEGQTLTVMAFLTDPGHRYIITAFDLLDSDFRLKTAFPIFLQNTTLYLAAGGLANTGSMVTPGDTVTLSVPPGADEVVIKRPTGSPETIKVEDRQTVTYARTRDYGLYSARFNDTSRTEEMFAANSLDEVESLVAPIDDLAIGGVNVQSVAGEVKTNDPLWQYAAAAALVILLLEWWIYNRRVMI